MKTETLVVGQLATNCYLVFCEETREALIIDPGDAADYIINRIKDLSLIPKAIIATHGHFDHILAVTELKLAFNPPSRNSPIVRSRDVETFSASVDFSSDEAYKKIPRPLGRGSFNIPFYLHQADLPILKRTQKTAKYFLRMDVDPPIMPDKCLKEGTKIKFGQEELKVLETSGHTQGSVCLYDGKKYLFVGDTMFAGGNYGRTDLPGGDQQKLEVSIKKLLEFPSKTIIYPGHGNSTTVGKEIRFYTSLSS